MKKIGPWTVKATTTPYENPWIRIEHNEVIRPDGKDGTYGVVRFANLAVGVLPLFADGTTMLVGQHRFPFDAYSWELPEGGGPKGEPPEATAHRELAEETGVRARQMRRLGECDLSNSVCDEHAIYFLAWELEVGEATPDADEVLGLQRVSLAQLLADMLEGRISDAFTHIMVGAALLQAQAGRLPKAPQDLILEAAAQIGAPLKR